MIVVAHRGANKEALENSWQAYDLAVAGGAQRIELDVHLTRDHHLVINHDLSLLKTTGKDLRINHLSRKEIAELRLLNGDAIPFLDEVLEKYFPNTEFNIEMKGNSPLLAEKVAHLLGGRKHLDRIVVSCFSPEPLMYFAECMPIVPRACLWGDAPCWPWLGVHSVLVMMDRCKAKILHPYTNWLNHNVMDQARNRGWKVIPYVSMVGEEDDKEGLWGELMTLGVDGLCTNYPRQLKVWLGQVAAERSYLQSQES